MRTRLLYGSIHKIRSSGKKSYSVTTETLLKQISDLEQTHNSTTSLELNNLRNQSSEHLPKNLITTLGDLNFNRMPKPTNQGLSWPIK